MSGPDRSGHVPTFQLRRAKPATSATGAEVKERGGFRIAEMQCFIGFLCLPLRDSVPDTVITSVYSTMGGLLLDTASSFLTSMFQLWKDKADPGNGAYGSLCNIKTGIADLRFGWNFIVLMTRFDSFACIT